MKNFFLILCIIFFNSFAFAQNLNNKVWCFGDSALIKYDNGIFTYDTTSSIKTLEGCASYCNDSGQLLFYSDGIRIWNRNHDEMPNADSINGGPPFFDWGTSTTQAALFLPKPDSPNLYYLFYLKSGLASPSFQYCLIDLTLNGGLGDVILKNQILVPGILSEKMAAVKHGNGVDWWLYVHDTNDRIFIRFLINPSGIQGPFYQTIGSNWHTNDFVGQMSISPDGSKLAIVSSYIINVFYIDRCTGLLSNAQKIESYLAPLSTRYGCAFSPNNQYLYMSTQDSLFQYNLNDSFPHQNRFLLYYNPYFQNPLQNVYPISLGSLQNWNDKIILASGLGGNIHIDFSYNKNLSVINAPNLSQTLCNFQGYSIPLPYGRCVMGLPNMPNYNLGPLSDSPCDTITAINNQIQKDNFEFSIYPNPTSDNFNLQTNQKGILIIYNQLGQIIFTTQLEKSHTTINTNNFSKGIYFVQLKTDKNIFNQKIILQ